MKYVPSTSTTTDTTELLDSLIKDFRRSSKIRTISFRKLVPWLNTTERATHNIHPYPAKLITHIPHFFLANTKLSKPGDYVLDPFCGSGTVLLESILHGRPALGADANPLARLISRVKVQAPVPANAKVALKRLVKRTNALKQAAVPNHELDLNYWFYPHTISELAKLSTAIATSRSPEIRDFFRLCLSACIRRVSLADPRLSVPVRSKPQNYPKEHWLRSQMQARLDALRSESAFVYFTEIAKANILRCESMARLWDGKTSAVVSSDDARALRNVSGQRLESGSIQLIITSPPYLGAQKYIRSSSLPLGWVDLMGGMSLRQLEDLNIGREHFPKSKLANSPTVGIADADSEIGKISKIDPLRAHIAAVYLAEMRQAAQEMVRVLRPNGYLVLVAANNLVRGTEFRTQQFLQEIFEGEGLVLRLHVMDEIRSRGLMTRRNKTAGVIERESVLLFQKEGR